MKIITVSREFSSGGRELGKRLADCLGFDYYDKEIIASVAASAGIDENYAERMLEEGMVKRVPLSFRCSVSGPAAVSAVSADLLIKQRSVIEAIGKAGRDCVIIGRNADCILREYSPFNIFVCADADTKLARFHAAGQGKDAMSDRAIIKSIREIDKSRAKIRELITDCRWGERTAYHLTVNTSGWSSIKELVPAVADFATRWFERKNT